MVSRPFFICLKKIKKNFFYLKYPFTFDIPKATKLADNLNKHDKLSF